MSGEYDEAIQGYLARAERGELFLQTPISFAMGDSLTVNFDGGMTLNGQPVSGFRVVGFIVDNIKTLEMSSGRRVSEGSVQGADHESNVNRTGLPDSGIRQGGLSGKRRRNRRKRRNQRAQARGGERVVESQTDGRSGGQASE